MTDFDVCIIGGGPGGSTCANYLRRLGYSVAVFEKEIFPRDHVGESLIPYTYYKLQEMGVLESIHAFTTKKPGVNFVDRDGLRQSVWCFDKILNDGAEMSMHTLRAPFDHALLKRAAELGAEVYEGATVKHTDLTDPNCAKTEVEFSNGTRKTITSKFLVDASGQHSFLASRNRNRTPYEGLDRIALFTHWVNTKYDAALSGGLIKIVYLGGEKLGWLWVIPVGRNHLSIGVTLNNAYVKEQKKALGSNWKETLYRQQVEEALCLKTILADAQIEHEIQVMGDYSYNVEKKFGDNYAHVGDSGAFLDPIFSSGIYVAMEVAERVANCLDIKFKQGHEAGEAAFVKEYQTINNAYQLIEKFIRLFYNPDLLNFSHTGSSDDGYQKFLNAYEIFHYLLAGDFFSQTEKYSSFIDTLNNERSFNQFVHFVKTKANEFPTEHFCNYSFEDVYGHLPEGNQVAPGLLRGSETKLSESNS
ncbi:MAG: NAD(P)/FAD-dependent oxidoreductase [Bacteroidota bacterium]|jgi:flavin-dependent dehydrogenase